MRNQLIQKSILKILNRVSEVYLKEDTLAAEVEIAIDRSVKVDEFTDELNYLADRELIEKDTTLLDEPMWHITGKGKLAAREGIR